jgi:hypothetical protein
MERRKDANWLNQVCDKRWRSMDVNWVILTFVKILYSTIYVHWPSAFVSHLIEPVVVIAPLHWHKVFSYFFEDTNIIMTNPQISDCHCSFSQSSAQGPICQAQSGNERAHAWEWERLLLLLLQYNKVGTRWFKSQWQNRLKSYSSIDPSHEFMTHP